MARADGAVARLTAPAAAAASAAVARARALPLQPWSILVPLVLIQWAAVAAFALTVRHNGWLYYQGGDQTWYYTGAWTVADGAMPVAKVGWVGTLLLAPVSLVAGPSFLSALPAIVLLQTVVLLPVALGCIYAIGARLGGRRLGYAAAAAWIGAPFLMILAADPRYHERWVEQFLPQLLGLTGLADFPSLVLLLVTAVLLLRAVERTGLRDPLLAGTAAGLAIGLKPANALFLFAAGGALLVARRWSGIVVFAIAMLPALAALALWKQRGLGHTPLLALDGQLLAAGLGPLAGLPAPSGLLGAINNTYLDVNWHQLDQNLVTLREYFWGTRILHVLPFVGAAAVLRRSRPAGVLIGLWFAAFLVIKGSSEFASVDSGSFFRFLMPAMPAFVLLAAATLLLVPGAGGALVRRGRELSQRRRPALLPGRALLGLVGLAGAIPLIVLAVLPQAPAGKVVDLIDGNLYLATSARLKPQALVAGDEVRLTWQPMGSANARTFYRVYRWEADPLRAGSSVGSTGWMLATGSTVVNALRETAVSDHPGSGRWWYAIGLSANWLDDTTKGDPYLLSAPIAIDVP